MSTINGIAAGAYAEKQASQDSQARIQDSRVADTIVEKSQSLKQDTSVLVEISRAARVLVQQKLADARQGAVQQDAAVELKAERSPV